MRVLRGFDLILNDTEGVMLGAIQRKNLENLAWTSSQGKGLPPHPDGPPLPPGEAPKCITRLLPVRCSAAKYPSVQGIHSNALQEIKYSTVCHWNVLEERCLQIIIRKQVGSDTYGLPGTQVHEEPLICKETNVSGPLTLNSSACR